MSGRRKGKAAQFGILLAAMAAGAALAFQVPEKGAEVALDAKGVRAGVAAEIPFCMTGEYGRMKLGEAVADRMEAEGLIASIEAFRGREQREAEEAFRKHAEELAKGPRYLIDVTEKDIAEMENLVEAEAGNQDLKGKRLVAGVVISRVQSEGFPDTVHGVISQKYQFSSYWDGGMEKWSEISDEAKEAVRLELQERLYPELLYFTAGGYGKYGTPAFKYGDHYFCTE